MGLRRGWVWIVLSLALLFAAKISLEIGWADAGVECQAQTLDASGPPACEAWEGPLYVPLQILGGVLGVAGVAGLVVGVWRLGREAGRRQEAV